MKLAVIAVLLVLAGCDAVAEPSAPPADSPHPADSAQPATIYQLLGPWSPTPFLPSPELLAAADRACKAALGPDSSHHIELMELKVVDVRGTGIAQAFFEATNGDAQAACYEMSIAPDSTVTATGGGSSGGGSAGPIAPLEIRIADTSWSAKGASTWVHVAGQIGAAIARVEIVRPGQPLVRASIANGWFAAWVPAAMPGGWSVRGFDATGAQVASVPPP